MSRPPALHYRELRFEGPVDPKSRAVPVVVSTDAPYDRGAYIEILDHSPGGCDLARAPLPLIESHDSRVLNIGIVEKLRLAGGRLRGEARFGLSARAEEVLADVKSKVVRGVSIGYERLDEGVPVPYSSKRTLKFKFRPYEVSCVAVPADTEAGFYRSKESTVNNMHTPIDDFGSDAANAQPQSRSQRRAQAYQDAAGAEQERERVTGILALSARHNMREFGDRHVRDGTPLELFRGLALDELHKRGSDRPLYQPPSEIGLSPREVRSFSLAKLYRSMIERDASVAPFERECVAEVHSRMERVGLSRQRGGTVLPYELLKAPIPAARVVDGRMMVGDRVIGMTRDLSTSTVGAGGAMVATDLLYADFIDLLRARTLVRAMGATLLGGLVGNVAIPRQTGAVTMNWVAQGGAASESDATFATVSLTPKTAHAIQDVTRDLLIQGTPAVEGIVRADLLTTMATTIDYVALNGTGASNQPTGVLSQVGIGSVAGGTNGAAPTWDHAVQLEEVVASLNSDRGALGYMTNPKVRSKWKRTQKFSGTNGQEVFERAYERDDPGAFGVVNGYRCGVTNNVRSDLTKGTSSGVCSAIVYGAWNDLLIGEWQTAEILPDQVTQAANRIIRMHVWQTVDIAVRRAQSFAAMLDALTT